MRLLRSIKNPETYINFNGYESSKVCTRSNIVVEHRSNNPKRDYLFVNKLQCKHIPCSPSKMVEMSCLLAKRVNETLKDNINNGTMNEKSRILVIGFAETATAIGTFVAENLDFETYVLHTTREDVEGSKELIRFEEEHSHATTQKLLTWNKIDVENFLSLFSYILFVEDEISTGNTILNFIKAFNKNYSSAAHNLKFGVASICNWQDNEASYKFEDMDIDRFFLISGELKDVNAKMFNEADNVELIDEIVTDESSLPDKVLDFRGIGEGFFRQERLGYWDYEDTSMCIAHSGNVERILEECKDAESVRIIGTEEFMAIPIEIGIELEVIGGKDVICHATTRSKIDVMKNSSDGAASGITERYKVNSAYDALRNTYVYNLNEHTDVTLIISDAPDMEQFISMASTLTNALKGKTDKVIAIRL